MNLGLREVCFQEDNFGTGPTICEVHRPEGWCSFYEHLNAELLDQLIAEGVTEILLLYRGFWRPADLYRTYELTL